MDPDQWHEVRFGDGIDENEILKIFHPKVWPLPQGPVQLPGPAPQPVPRARPHFAVQVGSAVAGDARVGGRGPALRAPGGVPLRVHREAQRHHHTWLVCSLGRSICSILLRKMRFHFGHIRYPPAGLMKQRPRLSWPADPNKLYTVMFFDHGKLSVELISTPSFVRVRFW